MIRQPTRYATISAFYAAFTCICRSVRSRTSFPSSLKPITPNLNAILPGKDHVLYADVHDMQSARSSRNCKLSQNSAFGYALRIARFVANVAFAFAVDGLIRCKTIRVMVNFIPSLASDISILHPATAVVVVALALCRITDARRADCRNSARQLRQKCMLLN